MRQNWRPHLHWRILRPTRAVSQSWSWLGTLSVPFHHYDNRQLLLYIARKSSWHLSARNTGEKFTKSTTTSTKKSLLFGCQQREEKTPRSESKPLFLPSRKVWKEKKCWGRSPYPRRSLNQSWPQCGMAPLCLRKSWPEKQLLPFDWGPFRSCQLREQWDSGTSTCVEALKMASSTFLWIKKR